MWGGGDNKKILKNNRIWHITIHSGANTKGKKEKAQRILWEIDGTMMLSFLCLSLSLSLFQQS